jgi:tRNA dimethylallyltransferase
MGELSYDEMFVRLNTAIHQFSKRQMTWFRRMEKKGIRIYWMDGHLSEKEKVAFCLEKMNAAGLV